MAYKSSQPRILTRHMARELSPAELEQISGSGGTWPTPVEQPTNIGPNGDTEIIYVPDRDT